MPGRDEVEDSKSRGERSSLDGAVVRALLSESDIQQGNENGREDQHNDQDYGKGDHGSGHGRLLVMRVLEMEIEMEGIDYATETRVL